ncbi:hypothetical protein PAXINDRAFT_6904 [Paxillus involutus ATCC 200175]|nr:hypothetical protein PAXINDRAFT_6904 [Paxillus involutus ATCC 200175]
MANTSRPGTANIDGRFTYDGTNGTPPSPRVNGLGHHHPSSSDFILQHPLTIGRAASTGSTTSWAQTDSL